MSFLLFSVTWKLRNQRQNQEDANKCSLYHERKSIMTTSSMNVRRLVYSAICLALCLVLPLLTGQIPQIGRMLSPMHIPVFLCGFLCGWPYGLAVGAIAPILRGAIFGMPVLFPTGIAMAFELATYGFVSGLLFRALPKTTLYLYVDLVISMLCGRAVWGIVSFLLAGITQTEFSFGMFIAGAFTNAVPGIILHLLLIPAVVMAMVRAHLVLNAAV
jgi:thiamine transporter ThiT